MSSPPLGPPSFLARKVSREFAAADLLEARAWLLPASSSKRSRLLLRAGTDLLHARVNLNMSGALDLPLFDGGVQVDPNVVLRLREIRLFEGAAASSKPHIRHRAKRRLVQLLSEWDATPQEVESARHVFESLPPALQRRHHGQYQLGRMLLEQAEQRIAGPAPRTLEL